MCGIAGIFKTQGLEPDDLRLIAPMTDVISYRGPDNAGTFLSRGTGPQIALGHRRLSIIDLSVAGHQPMSDPTGRYTIVFNGEIYNFMSLRSMLEKRGINFTSHSDTEVLLKLFIEFGQVCLSMLEGMFAFAIWDEFEKRVFIARDRAGKKPLFYSYNGVAIYFASEIKSLLMHPQIKPEPNIDQMSCYFQFRYVPSPQTMFKDIFKLPPASYAWVSSSSFLIERYWNPPPKQYEISRMGFRDIEDEFMRMLSNAVEKRLIADVPIGSFLSGGIDSSAIVALMSKLTGDRVKTYSVGFNKPWESELNYAKTIAETFNTDHHEIIVTPDDFQNNLDKLIWHRDAPIAEPADIPIHLLSKLASEKVKVVFSGEGSDEILGGYYKYLFELYAQHFRRLPNFLRSLFTNTAKQLPGKFSKLSHYLSISNVDNATLRSFKWFASSEDTSYLSNKELAQTPILPEGIDLSHLLLGYQGLDLMMYYDLQYWLPDNLLERADRLTMANSIELRTPFLDQNLVEFCCLINPSLKTRGASTKIILKMAMRGILPDNIINRPKSGFSTPLKYWLSGNLKDWSEDIVFSKKCRQRGIFDHSKLRIIFDDHHTGKKDHTKAIWTVLNFELWSQIFFDSNSTRDYISD